MRKYLMIGLALIFAHGSPAARALSGCPNMGLNNASPPANIVVGSTVEAFVVMPAETDVWIWLDGNFVEDESNPNTNDSAAVFDLPLSYYGAHTLQDSLDSDCILNFTNVPAGQAPAPSAPALSGAPVRSGSPISVRSNSPHTLSWTVPSGTINHYTISRGSPGNPEQTYTLPAGTTSQVLTSTAPAGTNRVIEFKVHACSSSDESSCSAWSNAVDIHVKAP
jgi:hypothetical protein